MKKDKDLGPDVFLIEFFQEFWGTIKIDSLAAVKESQKNKQILWALNSTFLSLIPKGDRADRFSLFFPISLFNVIYKIISNLIADRFKK